MVNYILLYIIWIIPYPNKKNHSLIIDDNTIHNICQYLKAQIIAIKFANNRIHLLTRQTSHRRLVQVLMMFWIFSSGVASKHCFLQFFNSGRLYPVTKNSLTKHRKYPEVHGVPEFGGQSSSPINSAPSPLRNAEVCLLVCHPAPCCVRLKFPHGYNFLMFERRSSRSKLL